MEQKLLLLTFAIGCVSWLCGVLLSRPEDNKDSGSIRLPRPIFIAALILPVPVFLATTFPGTQQALNRLMVAQDTGGAINGAVRADFYWGFGDEAGVQAGRMKQQGRMWVLLPRGYNPNAGVEPSAITPVQPKAP